MRKELNKSFYNPNVKTVLKRLPTFYRPYHNKKQQIHKFNIQDKNTPLKHSLFIGIEMQTKHTFSNQLKIKQFRPIKIKKHIEDNKIALKSQT